MSEPGLDEEQSKAILAEIIALSTLPPKQRNDITLQAYAREGDCSETTASRRLMKLVEAGVLMTSMVYDSERHCRVRVWRKVEGMT